MSMFSKAKNEQGKIKINIYGKAGSGKSFTSLLIAEGLANVENKKIAVIDSEKGYEFYGQAINSRQVHKEAFDFYIVKTKSIFEATKASKEAIESDDFGVIIVDAVSEYYEAAKKAWPGKRNKIGAYPIHAWQWIYKTYDDFINPLLDCNKHVIFCGRMGNVYSQETGDDMKVIGKKMKGKSEQPYETQMLVQMDNDNGIVSMYVEKDRSSVLLGKTIKFPNFENTIKLVMPYLSKTHVPISERDDVTLAVEKQQASIDLLSKMKLKVGNCCSMAELNGLKDELTKAKSDMDSSAIAELVECYSVKAKSFDEKAESILSKIK
jgi:hypothetical protein